MPEMIEEDAFTAVAALRGWCKPVYVRERPDYVDLTSDEVAVKLVLVCLSAREDRESSFHHSGGPVNLM